MAGSGEQGELFRCFTLEDEHREEKVLGHTRIPAGRYQIRLRADGGMHAKYSRKYPWHRGMLWLQGVPDFKHIYIHPGNRHEHTSGCILVGDGALSNLPRVGDGMVTYSVDAYKALYSEIVGLLDLGRRVFIEVVDVA